MSLEASAAVWSDDRLKGGALIVALALADYSWPDGWSFPAVATLATKARMDKRNCAKVLRRLELDGHLQVLEGAGYRGTNLYGLTAVTRGKFDPPTPGEIEEAMRNGRFPRHRQGVKGTPGKKPSPPAKSPPGSRLSKKTPEPYLTNPPPIEGIATGAVEWPSLEAVLAFAKAYPGCPAKGCSGSMPVPWASDWWAYHTYRLQKFAPDWQAEMTFRFERDFQDRLPKALGLAVPSVNGRTPSVWERKQALELLKKRAANHVANEGSAAYFSDCSAQEQAEFAELQERIRDSEAALERTAA